MILRFLYCWKIEKEAAFRSLLQGGRVTCRIDTLLFTASMGWSL